MSVVYMYHRHMGHLHDMVIYMHNHIMYQLTGSHHYPAYIKMIGTLKLL